MKEEQVWEWLEESKRLINEAEEDQTYRELELEIEILEAILR